jgi:hypothetical protein
MIHSNLGDPVIRTGIFRDDQNQVIGAARYLSRLQQTCFTRSLYNDTFSDVQYITRERCIPLNLRDIST